MSTTDSPWGDTGFDANDDGFMKLPPRDRNAQEPASEPEQQADASHDAAAASTERVRVEPISAMPPIAPPPAVRKRRSSLVWVALLALLVLVVAIIGVELYRTSRSIEEQAFVGAAVESEAPVEPSMPSVDEASAPSDSAVVGEPATTNDASVVRAEAQPPTPASTKPSVSLPDAKTPQTESTVAPRKPSGGEPVAPPSKTITTRKAQTNATGPAWVVQVFASPSRDDAEEWLQQLREQRIPDGYIVEQKVKGQSWYRVRFGQFATRIEAEQAATNRGFAQPWIARVR